MLWRHGDVLIAAVAALPALSQPERGTVLAYGEITGHSHHLKDASSAELWSHGGQLYLKVVAQSATIVHEEHHPITLPRGVYRIWMQREYSPGQIRSVRD